MQKIVLIIFNLTHAKDELDTNTKFFFIDTFKIQELNKNNIVSKNC
jgi:hypothetical protein